MNCADIEILIADYVDDTLHGEQKAAFHNHISSCAGCAELARDASGAVAFMDRATVAQPPPELVTKLLFEIHSGPSRAFIKPSFARRWFGSWLAPVMEPRFAMGMAMTVLSFAMLGRLSGIEVRQLKPSDLNPVNVWMAAEDRVHRAWTRSVKYYESIRVVYEIETQLKEWNGEQPDPSNASPENGTKGK